MESLPSPDSAFGHEPFRLRDAEDRGYGTAIFRHPRWSSLSPGVRALRSRPANLYERALQYLPRLREGERFSHATALALLGCPIRVPLDAPVDVSSPASMGQVRCRGVKGHRHAPASAAYPCAVPEIEERIDVVPPLQAVQQAALQLPFRELVVALDHLIRDDPKHFDRWLLILPEELDASAAAASGRGAVRFREAAKLARIGAESRMETLMRLIAVRAGMRELRLQAEIRDAAGRWIGRFDAADDESRSLFEYDGEQHLYSSKQRRRDPRKHQRARDAGWRIMVFYAEDVLEDPAGSARGMLEFSGQRAGRARSALVRLLDEDFAGGSESAIPYRDPSDYA